jgi:parallel beta-helix repeat protein
VIFDAQLNFIGAQSPNCIAGNNSWGVALIGGSNNVGSNNVRNNYIGTNATGNLGLGNHGPGVWVESSGNRIGRVDHGNVISGNDGPGVLLSERLLTGAGASGNELFNNYIGTDYHGAVAIPNGQDGVRLETKSHDNIIDGSNVISGNNGSGVALVGVDTTGNQVANNRIGTDYTGLAAIGNANDVYIGGGAHDNTIGGPGPNNTISGNRGVGIWLSGSHDNNVLGNYIGLKFRGDQALGNGEDGVLTDNGAHDNNIGQNVISGNLSSGVALRSGNNRVGGNFIGINATSVAALGNHFAGVTSTSGGNTISYNVISGNEGPGVLLTGAEAVNNLLYRNTVGLDNSGNLAIPNHDGVVIAQGAQHNTIGAGDYPNVISGNSQSGVLLSGATDNLVEGNCIGTNAAGIAARANGTGVLLTANAATNVIRSNVIAGNRGEGVMLRDGGSSANAVSGNYIGTDRSGTAVLGERQHRRGRRQRGHRQPDRLQHHRL